MGTTTRKSNVASMMERSADKIEQKTTQASSKAANTMRKMAENVRNIDVETYKARMKERMDSARAEVDKNVKNVETGIKDHPFESVAIAAGAGLLLGATIALLGRRAAVRKYYKT